MIPRQILADPLLEHGVENLLPGHVHGNSFNGKRRMLSQKFAHLFQNDPAYVVDEPAFLGHRDKLIRTDKSAVPTHQADQRLRGHKPIFPAVDNRLVVHLKGFLLHRKTDLSHHVLLMRQGIAHLPVKKEHAASSPDGENRHRIIHFIEQVVRRIPGLRKKMYQMRLCLRLAASLVVDNPPVLFEPFM